MEVEGQDANVNFFGNQPVRGAVVEDDNLQQALPLPDPFAHDAADAIAAERARAAFSLRMASQFMREGVFKEVFFVRQILEPQRRLMYQFLHLVGSAWETQQFMAELVNGERQYRLPMFVEAESLRIFFREIRDIWCSPSLWREYASTESFRTKLLQQTMRLGSVCYQLVRVPTRGFPYRLFLLLTPQGATATFAREILETKQCMLDHCTKQLLRTFSSVEALLSDQFKAILVAIARWGQGTTYSTERLHSKNLRTKLGRQTHAPDIEHLALSHAGWAAPSWCEFHAPSISRPDKPRGRPRKRPRDAVEKGGKQKRRRGGGGPFRAFLHMELKGRSFKADVMQEMKAKYAALTPQQRQRYIELGQAGSLLRRSAPHPTYDKESLTEVSGPKLRFVLTVLMSVCRLRSPKKALHVSHS